MHSGYIYDRLCIGRGVGIDGVDGRVEPQRHTVHCNLVSICREPGSYLERFPKIRGTNFGGPHNKDYSILGSILGSPYFGKLPFGKVFFGRVKGEVTEMKDESFG